MPTNEPKPNESRFKRNPDGTLALPAAAARTTERVPTKLYELRTLSGCPLQTVHISMPSSGNVATFAAYRGLPMMTPEGRFQGPVQEGGLMWLTDAEVADIFARVETLRVLARPNGTGGVYDVDSPHLRGASGDEPLGKYLSIGEVPAPSAEKPPMSMAG